MAPEFEQYKKALRNNIETNVKRAQEELLRRQEQLKAIDGLPKINMSVPGPENGDYSFSMFAHKAMEDVMHSTENKETDPQQRLNSVLDIGKSLVSADISLDEKINLVNPTSKKYDYPKRSNTIIFNGKEFKLSRKLMQLFQCFEDEEGIQLTDESLVNRMGVSKDSIHAFVNRLREKLEDDPRHPVFFVTKRKRGTQPGSFVYRSPERVAREEANQSSKT